jgi:hypothetical protein
MNLEILTNEGLYMTNVYVVVNKWTTTDTDSPGYISGFGVGMILTALEEFPGDVQHLDMVLQTNSIGSAYFDSEIYTNYANAAQGVYEAGKVQGFARAELNASLRYSLLIYLTEQDDFFVHDSNISVVQNMDTARTAFMKLLNLQCETRRGYKDISNDILEKIYLQDQLTLDQVQGIFDSL